MKKLLTILILMLIALPIIELFYWAPNRLKIETIEIHHQDIPSSFKNTKILIFSDVYSSTDRLIKVKEIANSNEFDFIIYLGNLFEEDVTESKLLSSILKEMNAPLGKFALLGHYDYNHDLSLTKKTLEDGHFRVIQNQLLPIHRYDDSFIQFAFLDNKYPEETHEHVKKDNENFTIGFLNDPLIIDDLGESILDLAFAGETQQGKVKLPLLGSLFYRNTYIKKYQIINKMPLYLTAGVSTKAPKVRFLTQPDVIILELYE